MTPSSEEMLDMFFATITQCSNDSNKTDEGTSGTSKKELTLQFNYTDTNDDDNDIVDVVTNTEHPELPKNLSNFLPNGLNFFQSLSTSFSPQNSERDKIMNESFKMLKHTFRLQPDVSRNFLSTPPRLDNKDLIKMKGPSRLIGFLVTIAMDEKSSKALRWTGNGLEFILLDRELVARMWGNRKHNTKDMDYLKLSRAIREKYEKKENGKIIKVGKLAKGSKIYSYVFTKHSHSDLVKYTEKTIPEILEYALKMGAKAKAEEKTFGSLA